MEKVCYICNDVGIIRMYKDDFVCSKECARTYMIVYSIQELNRTLELKGE